jgi:hypothetical protein
LEQVRSPNGDDRELSTQIQSVLILAESAGYL